MVQAEQGEVQLSPGEQQVLARLLSCDIPQTLQPQTLQAYYKTCCSLWEDRGDEGALVLAFVRTMVTDSVALVSGAWPTDL